MTDLKAKVEDLRLRDMYPRDLGDLFDGDQILLVGRYYAKDAAKLKRGEGKYRTNLVISGTYRGRERAFEYPVTVNPAGRDARFLFVEQIWAVRRVGYLLDQIQLHGESKEIIDELVSLSSDYGIMTPYTSFLADEGVKLGDAHVLRGRARDSLSSLRVVRGGQAQVAAKTRQTLRLRAARPAPTRPGGKGVALYGFSGKDTYEAEKKEMVGGVRLAGGEALYRRRGKAWVTPQVAKMSLDLEKDADKIVEIKLFSEKYFELIRKNTVLENQVLASQQPGEELLIALRGQVYRIR